MPKFKLTSFAKIATLIWLGLFITQNSYGSRLDSLELDQKPGSYPAPLNIKILTIYEGKLYYDVNGEVPSKNSSLYKGIIRLRSPKNYSIRFLYENPLGEEKFFGPFQFKLTPPKGYSQDLPEPSLPEGIYDSVIFISFPKLKKGEIQYALDNPKGLQTYKSQKIMLNKTSTLYYKVVYNDNFSTDVYSAKYIILLEPPKARLTTQQRKFNYEPKLQVELEKATQAFYTTDPLAPQSAFKPVEKFIQLGEGKHHLRIYASNIANMKSEIESYHITVDATPPSVKYFVDLKSKSAKLSSNEPGVIFFTTDGSTPTLGSEKYKKPIPLPKDGILPIRFFAVDTIGNESPLAGFKASSDVEPPTLTFTPNQYEFSKTTPIEFRCNEACQIVYSLNEKEASHLQKSQAGPFLKLDLSKEGVNKLHIYAKDMAGNSTPKQDLEFLIDTKAPKVTYRLKKLATSDNSLLIFEANEPAEIYYSLNGQKPSRNSLKYNQEIEVKPGSELSFIAIDKLNNTSEPVSLTDFLNPAIAISPSGGIYNKTLNISLKPQKRGEIYYKLSKDGVELNPEYSFYQAPLELKYSGTYIVSYYMENSNEQGIREEMYIIDKQAPQIVPLLEKSLIGGSYTLIFKLSEPAIIHYTLDKSSPKTPGTNQIGSIVKLSDWRVNIKREVKQVLKYFAVDRANNETSIYELDLFSPYVTVDPPPGEYNSVLSIELGSQEGNTVYFSFDSVSLSPKSPIYKRPLIVSESKDIWFYATDITGYNGPKQKASYRINFPPEANFSPKQKKNYSGKPITFDARLSIDKETPFEILQFRWDFNNDGVFDTPFSNEPFASTKYTFPQIAKVTLEVKDDDDLSGTITHNIKVYPNCPLDMVAVLTDSSQFCIDKVEYVSDSKAVPETEINWAEAQMLCLEKGKRLCKLSEWKSACYSSKTYHFGYGNKYSPENCNTEGKNVWAKGDKNNGCVSSEGVFDLIGNVWEWVEDVQQGAHVIAGGSFNQGSAASCNLDFPSVINTSSEEVGFRCCQ